MRCRDGWRNRGYRGVRSHSFCCWKLSHVTVFVFSCVFMCADLPHLHSVLHAGLLLRYVPYKFDGLQGCRASQETLGSFTEPRVAPVALPPVFYAQFLSLSCTQARTEHTLTKLASCFRRKALGQGWPVSTPQSHSCKAWCSLCWSWRRDVHACLPACLLPADKLLLLLLSVPYNPGTDMVCVWPRGNAVTITTGAGA